jgi:hypothetical protein
MLVGRVVGIVVGVVVGESASANVIVKEISNADKTEN